MIFWFVVAVIGVMLSLWGLFTLLHKFRRGEITRRYFIAIVVGYISFVSFALVNALRPDITTGLVTILMLLPAFIAILVVVHERKSTN
jgi:uncharacterized membrane protein